MTRARSTATRIPTPKPANQNLLIAQVVNFLNANNCLVWRQENNGRIDQESAVQELTNLLFALAHVNYKPEKITPLVKAILHKAYRPVPSTLKGVSDVVGINLRTGGFIAVEVKCGADIMRPEQEQFRQVVREAGAEWWLCREIESFKSGWYRKHQPQASAAQ